MKLPTDKRAISFYSSESLFELLNSATIYGGTRLATSLKKDCSPIVSCHDGENAKSGIK
jgi:hypothetical protein